MSLRRTAVRSGRRNEGAGGPQAQQEPQGKGGWAGLPSGVYGRVCRLRGDSGKGACEYALVEARSGPSSQCPQADNPEGEEGGESGQEARPGWDKCARGGEAGCCHRFGPGASPDARWGGGRRKQEGRDDDEESGERVGVLGRPGGEGRCGGRSALDLGVEAIQVGLAWPGRGVC